MYVLTEISDVTNSGYNKNVIEFDTFVELQDHILHMQESLNTDESELYTYNISIKELK